jgi:hypothetical protein
MNAEIERMTPLEKFEGPARNGTPKRSRFKRGRKKVRGVNGKHKRRLQKILW